MAYSEHLGYKATDGQRRNRFGVLIEEGKIYTAYGEIIPGAYNREKMNGYHMSEPLANVFRYFDCETKGIEVAEVKGFGTCIKFEDDYNGYFDMYACSNVEILRYLKREEYVERMLHQSEDDIRKFLMTFKLKEDEKDVYLDRFKNNYRVKEYMAYYQYKDDAEKRERILSLKR